MKKLLYIIILIILIASLLGCTKSNNNNHESSTISPEFTKTTAVTNESVMITTEIQPVGSGSVTVNPSFTEYQKGSTVNLIARANNNMVFDRWSGDAIDTTPSIYVTLDTNKKVTANFIPLYNLSIEVSPPDAGSVTPSSGQFREGETVSLIINAGKDMVFDHWSGDIAGLDAATSILMDSNKQVIANFKALRTLSVNVSPLDAGSVTPSSGQFRDGETVSLTANPHTGFVFKYWSGDVSNTRDTINLLMDSNKNVVAVFQEAIPPGEVSDVVTNIGREKVNLSWQEPLDADFANVEVTYDGLDLPFIIDKGTTKIEITELTGQKQYNFSIRTVDILGNKSAGILVNATPLIYPDIWGKQFNFGNKFLYRWTGHNGYIDVLLDKVEVDSNGFMKLIITYQAIVIPYNALYKESDIGNTNMYLTDELNNRYDFVDIGGAAASYTVFYNSTAVSGWFTFPPEQNNTRIFFFHDGDLGVTSPEIVLENGIPFP
jgi:uncharacterized cupredoxin-like copper-binding protein